MRFFAPFVVLPAFTLALGACSGGSANLNPLSWFQSSGPKSVAVVPTGGFTEDQDGRLLVSQVVELKSLQSAGGIILRAKGLPPRLGYWDAELVPQNRGEPVEGVLTYEFRIAEPQQHSLTGQPRQRDVYVGRFMSDRTLAKVRSIRVIGAGNSRTLRR